MADLGDFFSGVGDIALEWLGGQVNPTNITIAPQPVTLLNGGGNGVTPIATAATPAPMAAQHCGPSPVYKKVCGQYRWVWPKRRRRRQLLTGSDAAGLTQLVNILGNGKATQAWIATAKR